MVVAVDVPVVVVGVVVRLAVGVVVADDVSVVVWVVEAVVVAVAVGVVDVGVVDVGVVVVADVVGVVVGVVECGFHATTELQGSSVRTPLMVSDNGVSAPAACRAEMPRAAAATSAAAPAVVTTATSSVYDCSLRASRMRRPATLHET